MKKFYISQLIDKIEHKICIDALSNGVVSVRIICQIFPTASHRTGKAQTHFTMKTFFAHLRMHQAALIMLCLLFPFIYSCGDDEDEGNGMGGDSGKGDFIEVTYQGKTYHGTLPSGLYASIEMDNDLTFGYSMASPKEFKKFEVYFGLVYPTYLEDFAHCKPGNYKINENPLWSGIYDNLEAQLFDFSLQMDFNSDEQYESIGGMNKVTKVTRKGDFAVVEGSFDVKMSNENYVSGYGHEKTYNMTGRYRMTISE